jgi:hypothetical protein
LRGGVWIAQMWKRELLLPVPGGPVCIVIIMDMKSPPKRDPNYTLFPFSSFQETICN